MGSGGYWTDEPGATQETKRREERYRTRLEGLVSPHLLTGERLVVVAEAIEGAHPALIMFDAGHAFYTKFFVVAATNHRLLTIQIPQFLPMAFRPKDDDRSAPLARIRCNSSTVLGCTRLEITWPGGDGLKYVFEPGWSQEAAKLAAILGCRATP